MGFPIGDERMGGGTLAEAFVYHFWLGVVCNSFVASDWVDSDE